MKKKVFYKEKYNLIYIYGNFVNNESWNVTLYSNICDQEVYIEYNYIEGSRLPLDNIDSYNEVKFYIMNLLDCKTRKKVEFETKPYTFINEINKYRKILNKKNSLFHDSYWQSIFNNLEKLFIDLSNQLQWKSSEQYISHGDLHYGNILINRKLINLIDFDEVCFSPKYFDLAIYIFKYFNPIAGKLTSETFKKIEMEFQTYGIPLSDIVMYIIKVIYQKKYLECTNKSSLDDWIVDNWVSWFNDLKIILKGIKNIGIDINYIKT
ncbi:phosphotransferase family protein [Carnobacterium divergens]|uniref:phosphotransferase family protein n=1 Tax=Carnobacterium divergens TaxID=2748 RepID=UPI0039C998D9